MTVWNYKSAVLSTMLRVSLFFAINVSAGLDAAVAAAVTDLSFRFVLAGFYGALTQALCRVEPPARGTLMALVLLPAVAHTLEWLVHWLSGTVMLAASLTASLALTAVSTVFTLFAMRRGVLTAGEDANSLLADLRRIPRLMLTFLTGAR